MPAEAVIEIDEKGDFTLDLSGFQGKQCKEVAQVFEEAGKVIDEITKPEYFD